jgi:hypothetical protein
MSPRVVAYKFADPFVPAVIAGLQPGPWAPGMKRQTIRELNDDPCRHARAGDIVELRQEDGTVIGVVRCRRYSEITIFGATHPYPHRIRWDLGELASGLPCHPNLAAANDFALRDGFIHFKALEEFILRGRSHGSFAMIEWWGAS